MHRLACGLLSRLRSRTSHPSTVAAACSSIVLTTQQNCPFHPLLLQHDSTFTTSTAASFPDLVLTSRRASIAELGLINLLLPNRQAFVPHFSPHGFSLLPRDIWNTRNSAEAKNLLGPATLPEPHWAAGLSNSTPAPFSDPESTIESLQTISIRTWRVKKMRKHKINKRRKDARHKSRKV